MGKATNPKAARASANTAAPTETKAAKAAALKAAKAATAAALAGLAWQAFKSEDADASCRDMIAAAGGSCEAAQAKFVMGTLVRKRELAKGAEDFDAGCALALKIMAALNFKSKKDLKPGQSRRSEREELDYQAAMKKFTRLAAAEGVDVGAGKSGKKKGAGKRKGAAGKMKGDETASETAEILQGDKPASPGIKTIPELARYVALQGAAMLATANKAAPDLKSHSDDEFAALTAIREAIASFNKTIGPHAKKLMAV